MTGTPDPRRDSQTRTEETPRIEKNMTRLTIPGALVIALLPAGATLTAEGRLAWNRPLGKRGCIERLAG